MANQPIARVDDKLDHGGHIIQGSPTVKCEDKPVARFGDRVMCDQHGEQTITTGSPIVMLENKKAARVTSVCSCGAIIITGSPTWKVP